MTRKSIRRDFVCPQCLGTGRVVIEQPKADSPDTAAQVSCPHCAGSISVPLPEGRQLRVEVTGRQAADVEKVLTSALRHLKPREDDKSVSHNPVERADIAIVAALDKELDALLRLGGPWARHQDTSSIRTYYTATTRSGLSVVAARASGMGQINAALLTRDVMALFRPRKIFLVGIAGGVGKEVSLGDIVISEQVVDYELGKITPDESTRASFCPETR